MTLEFGLALLLLGLGWGFWRLLQRRQCRRREWSDEPMATSPWTSSTSTSVGESAATAVDDVLVIAAWTILDTRPANPLGILADLPLDDAIDVRRYAEAVTSFHEREHRFDLEVAGEIISVATNMRDFARAGTQLTFELSSSIRAGLARGTLRLARDRHGRLLATVQDTRTGKITELLRGAPSGARIGAVTASVYGLAHLVSAQDLATRLDAVSTKVDLLIAFRHIDQRARLEAIYVRARELGMLPLDEAVKEQLRSLRHEVRELRYVWRGEVVHALGALRGAPTVNRLTARLPGTKKRHAAMHESLREAAGRVALMEFSLRLEHLLAVGSDEAEPFLRFLPDELNAWDELGDLLETKARTIGFEEMSAQPYVDAVREVVRVYRGGVQGVLAPEPSTDPLMEREAEGGGAGDGHG